MEVTAQAAPEMLQLVSTLALIDYMKATNHSIRSLATAVGVHRCTIERLRGGRQQKLAVEQARLLEQELGAPDGRLFRAPSLTRDSCSCGSRKSHRKALVA